MRGVRLNQVDVEVCRFWAPVTFHRDLSNKYGPDCVEVLVPSAPAERSRYPAGCVLGHVERKAALRV